MQITLDQDTWDVAEHVPLSEVLADLGGKAHARERVVDRLTVGGRTVTDRDLHPVFLAQTIAAVGAVHATTKSVTETLRCGRGSATAFASALYVEARQLLRQLRGGECALAAFDRWLGGLADYVEYVEHLRFQETAGGIPDSLTSGVAALLDARQREDTVCLADALEYEVLPHLKS